MNDERIACVQRLVAKLKVHLPAKIASAGPGDDFSATITDAAEFRAEGAVADTNFLNLVFWRNPAAGESIDDERCIAARSAACSGDLHGGACAGDD